MYYNYGPMGGHDWGWGIFMGALWLIFFVIIAFAVIRFLRSHDMSSGVSNDANNKPLDIVKQRYAKGEISKAEFEQMSKDLK